MRISQFCVLIIAAIHLPSVAQAQHFPPEEDLRTLLRLIVEDGPAPGAVLGILKADGTTSILAYGSPGQGAPPLGSKSTFEIGSVTKTFTATLLAEMTLRGEVSLEDPLSLYLPTDVVVPVADGRAITLLDLATHRSGLPDTPPGLQVGVIVPEEEYSFADAYEFLGAYELPYPPGTQRVYSNFGFALLGHALSRAAGESFEELIRSRILDPLGMRDTGFSQDTTGTTWTRGSRRGYPVRYRTAWQIMAGSGALYSSVEDLLRYLQAHISPPQSQLHEAMRMAYQIRLPEGPEGAGYGLAWAAEVLPGESPIVGHSGSTVGYRAQVRFMPDRAIGTVLLANSSGFDDNLASMLLLFDPPGEDWSATTVFTSDLSGFVGEYAAVSGDRRYHIEMTDDGILTYRPGESKRTPLFSRSDSSFYLLRAPITVTFKEGPDGRMEMEAAIDEREPSQQRVILRAIREGRPPAKR